MRSLALLIGVISVVWTAPIKEGNETVTAFNEFGETTPRDGKDSIVVTENRTLLGSQNSLHDVAAVKKMPLNHDLLDPSVDGYEVLVNGDVVVDDTVFSREQWISYKKGSSRMNFANETAEKARIWPDSSAENRTPLNSNDSLLLLDEDYVHDGVKFLENGNVIIDDMMFTREQWLRRTGKAPSNFLKSAHTAQARKWPDNTMYFYFKNPNSYPKNKYDEIRVFIYLAQRYLSEETCVQLIEDGSKPNAIPIIRPTDPNLCQSPVGYYDPNTKGRHILLGDNCAISVMHEFMHSLGWDHCHSRWDRDRHVTILKENIKGDVVHNFDISRDESEGFRVGGTPYEYGSIMHYSSTAGGKGGGLVTIKPKWNVFLYTMGNRERFSFLDIKSINQVYGCMSHGKLNCYNEGYEVRVGNSGQIKCNCPLGFQFEDDCAITTRDETHAMFLSDERKNTIVLGIGGNQKLNVVHIFKAPRFKKVSIQILALITNDKYCKFGCTNSYVEIKTKLKIHTGKRFCCQNDLRAYYIYRSTQEYTAVIYKQGRDPGVHQVIFQYWAE